MFTDYQMQEMSENFIDSFGFQDDEFTESDMNVSRGMRKLNNVNLLMQTDDSTKQAIFDSVCEQRIKRFGRLVSVLYSRPLSHTLSSTVTRRTRRIPGPTRLLRSPSARPR